MGAAKSHFDEMRDDGSAIRRPYEGFHTWFEREDTKRIFRKAREAETVFRRSGITFNVYGDEEATERLIPFDVIPRIISGDEWAHLTRGLEQRVRALNAFLHDIYHDQEILRAGRIPPELVIHNEAFLPAMVGVDPPGDVYCHIAGIDIIRTGETDFAVLEDNVRTPSGVSYMLENRETMLNLFPELFAEVRVRPVEEYPLHLRRALSEASPTPTQNPSIAVLTPGSYNSAYFEHAFLAEQMGVELVEGNDLGVIDGRVCMRTTQGDEPIDVLYRRVDDEYLDPLNFDPSSMLGIPGLFDIYRAGGITIANAPGCGIADDKAIYSYMPDIIEFYTGSTPILPNVQTWRCSEPDSLRYVLEHLDELVVKEVHGSGGYGMLVGPAAGSDELKMFESLLRESPSNYIAQPTLALSSVPVLSDSGLAPRHVDLRPFVLLSPSSTHITPGGLTRVAMSEGKLVVNSSQGGGTKDTWVLDF